MLRYFRQHNNLREIPDFQKGCGSEGTAISIVYPRPNTKVLLHATGKDPNGELVLEIANKNPEVAVYWHLDNEYLGKTEKIHQFISNPSPGAHTLSVTDELGHHAAVQFIVAAH